MPATKDDVQVSSFFVCPSSSECFFLFPVFPVRTILVPKQFVFHNIVCPNLTSTQHLSWSANILLFVCYRAIKNWNVQGSFRSVFLFFRGGGSWELQSFTSVFGSAKPYLFLKVRTPASGVWHDYLFITKQIVQKFKGVLKRFQKYMPLVCGLQLQSQTSHSNHTRPTCVMFAQLKTRRLWSQVFSWYLWFLFSVLDE